MRRTITDTADRLRNTDQLLVDGKWALVLAVTAAATRARPARLAVAICDPNGALTDLDAPQIVHLDAGETVTYRPGSMHLADVTGRRPSEADLTRRLTLQRAA